MLLPCLFPLSFFLFFSSLLGCLPSNNKETQGIPPTFLRLLVQFKISRIWSLCSDPTVLRPPGNTWGLYGGVQSNTWGLYGTGSPTWVRHIRGCIVLSYSPFLSSLSFSIGSPIFLFGDTDLLVFFSNICDYTKPTWVIKVSLPLSKSFT